MDINNNKESISRPTTGVLRKQGFSFSKEKSQVICSNCGTVHNSVYVTSWTNDIIRLFPKYMKCSSCGKSDFTTIVYNRITDNLPDVFILKE